MEDLNKKSDVNFVLGISAVLEIVSNMSKVEFVGGGVILVELFTYVFIMGLLVLMESHLVLMMDLGCFFLVDYLMVQITGSLFDE